jgi:hypothetical protein
VSSGGARPECSSSAARLVNHANQARALESVAVVDFGLVEVGKRARSRLDHRHGRTSSTVVPKSAARSLRRGIATVGPRNRQSQRQACDEPAAQGGRGSAWWLFLRGGLHLLARLPRLRLLNLSSSPRSGLGSEGSSEMAFRSHRATDRRRLPSTKPNQTGDGSAPLGTHSSSSKRSKSPTGSRRARASTRRSRRTRRSEMPLCVSMSSCGRQCARYVHRPGVVALGPPAPGQAVRWC